MHIAKLDPHLPATEAWVGDPPRLVRGDPEDQRGVVVRSDSAALYVFLLLLHHCTGRTQQPRQAAWPAPPGRPETGMANIGPRRGLRERRVALTRAHCQRKTVTEPKPIRPTKAPAATVGRLRLAERPYSN